MMKRLLPSDTPLLDRRTSDRPDDDRRGFWMRRMSPGEIVALVASSLALAGVLLSALGFTRTTPQQLEARVTKVELRVDTLSNEQEFIIYLQCVSLKRTDPPAVPPRCDRYTGTPRPR